MMNEHLNWKDHINIIKNKLSKNLGIYTKQKLFKYKGYEGSLFFIHS